MSVQRSGRAHQRGSFLCLVFCILFSACRDNKWPNPREHEVLATVGDAAITRAWFEQTYVGSLISTGQNDEAATRRVHLDNLIDAVLLGEEARRRGYEADSAFSIFRERERRKLLGDAFFKTAFLEELAPLTDTEIRKAFETWKREAVVRHLFYRSLDSAEAAYARLQWGTDFLDEAQRCYRLASFDSSAGYLGKVRYFNLDAAFAEAAFGLEEGSYSPPVQSRFGYHIILLERMLVSPILSESEYQTRRRGIASKARERKRMLEGDAFVRSFMAERDVQVDRSALEALALALEALENRAGPQPVRVMGGETRAADAEQLRASLSPETVLATYTWRGEERTLTAGTYAFWLPELSFPEARRQTVVSVGRVIRNEVFALEAEARGLDGLETSTKLWRRSTLELSSMLRKDLRADTNAVMADETMLSDAYASLRNRFERKTFATYWTAPFASMQEATAAKRSLAAGSATASRLTGYRVTADQDLAEAPEWSTHVSTAPVDQVMVVGLSGGRWYLLEVVERRTEEQNRADIEEDLRRMISPYYGEYRLIKQLRKATEIRVDSVLFAQMGDI